jgi:hypothetical protein
VGVYRKSKSHKLATAATKGSWKENESLRLCAGNNRYQIFVIITRKVGQKVADLIIDLEHLNSRSKVT